MRGVYADLRSPNNTLETISAAASAIAAAENRLPPYTIQKRRWGGWWRLHWCFGYMKNKKRIGHAVSLQDTSSLEMITHSTENPTQPVAIVLPLAAPPSSPASFFLSEPSSAANSPTGLLTFTSISANMYSPEGPGSIFAMGPYAHETQLVSPPVFSAFTTEPSTAPFTPPPESVHLTTPSSPEVPFAQLLDSKIKNGGSNQQYPFPHHEFQSYQFDYGSPVSHLVSPRSGISGSGASSPFPDGEFGTGLPHPVKFTTSNPPRLLTLEKLSTRVWGSKHASCSLTPDVITSCSKGKSNPPSVDGGENAGTVIHGGHQSYDIGYENHAGTKSDDVPGMSKLGLQEATEELLSVTPFHVKEFNFSTADGGKSLKPDIMSEWWTNERVVGNEGASTGSWSFCPMMQPNGS